jgi:SAM-dependent methyltransferase
MTQQSELFAGTAPWYRRFRPPYAPEAFAHVIDAFRLDGTGRLIDLGCGPGILSVPLSAHVESVLALDPDEGMLAEGRAYAAEQGRTNITWTPARAEEISPALGRFRCAVFGQSLHWMDRDLVFARLWEMVEPGGGFALINPGRQRPIESWETLTEPIVRKHLPPWEPPQRNPERTHEPALARSPFTIEEDVEYAMDIERDADGVVGYYWSTSGAGHRRLGAKAAAFEADVRAVLGAHYPPRWTETVTTGVIIGRRPAAD